MRIILPAGLSSDLDWKTKIGEGDILWEFDFGFSTSRLLLNDQAAFNAYTLAIDLFSKTLWKEHASRSTGVVLYRGSLDIVQRVMATEEMDEIETANVFGDFLHRLASFLPDEATPFCLFEATPFEAAKSAQLMSKERFWHLYLSLEENKSPRGILLPPDELCSPEILEKLGQLIRTVGPHRMIPETRLNEMWDGLDELYLIDEALSLQGKRHVRGFIAAGGEIKFGAEGFEPPTLCSQSRCASQTALCSERNNSTRARSFRQDDSL
jgi:hypothetical protein